MWLFFCQLITINSTYVVRVSNSAQRVGINAVKSSSNFSKSIATITSSGFGRMPVLLKSSTSGCKLQREFVQHYATLQERCIWLQRHMFFCCRMRRYFVVILRGVEDCMDFWRCAFKPRRHSRFWVSRFVKYSTHMNGNWTNTYMEEKCFNSKILENSFCRIPALHCAQFRMWRFTARFHIPLR